MTALCSLECSLNFFPYRYPPRTLWCVFAAFFGEWNEKECTVCVNPSRRSRRSRCPWRAPRVSLSVSPSLVPRLSPLSELSHIPVRPVPQCSFLPSLDSDPPRRLSLALVLLILKTPRTNNIYSRIIYLSYQSDFRACPHVRSSGRRTTGGSRP